MVAHLDALLEQAHDAGIITSLVTNGILLEHKWKKLEKNLDWVTLPIDGSQDSTQDLMTRRTGHLKDTLERLNMLRSAGKNLKVNTVVSKQNMHDLESIAALLRSQNIQRWKVFQFIPIRGFAAKNSDGFWIPDDEFKDVASRAVAQFTEPETIVTVADREYLQGNYFSILPDGSVRVSIDTQDFIVGSLLKQTVSDIWACEYFDKKKHYEHRKWLESVHNP